VRPGAIFSLAAFCWPRRGVARPCRLPVPIPPGPPSPVVILICEDQAQNFQAKYNAAAKNTYLGNYLGAGGGVKLFFRSTVQAFGFAYAMNKAQSDSAYIVGYRNCLAGK